MGKSDNEMAVCIARIDESSKSAHKRIDELQGIVKVFHSLASDVKVLAEQLVSMKEDVNYVKAIVNESQKKPSKVIDGVIQTAINGVVMIIIAAIMATIIK